jgi:hypothetical protein
MRRPVRSGTTLLEVAAAVGVGLLVVLAAFAAVDATSKIIAAGKRQNLEDELIAGAVRYLQATPVGTIQAMLPVGVPKDFALTVLGVAGGDYPVEWPQVWIERLGAGIDHANGAFTNTYQITMVPPGSGSRTNLGLSVTSLP